MCKLYIFIIYRSLETVGTVHVFFFTTFEPFPDELASEQRAVDILKYHDTAISKCQPF